MFKTTNMWCFIKLCWNCWATRRQVAPRFYSELDPWDVAIYDILWPFIVVQVLICLQRTYTRITCQVRKYFTPQHACKWKNSSTVQDMCLCEYIDLRHQYWVFSRISLLQCQTINVSHMWWAFPGPDWNFPTSFIYVVVGLATKILLGTYLWCSVAMSPYGRLCSPLTCNILIPSLTPKMKTLCPAN